MTNEPNRDPTALHRVLRAWRVALASGVVAASAVAPTAATAHASPARPCHRPAFTGRVTRAAAPRCPAKSKGNPGPPGRRGPRGDVGGRGATGFTGLPGPAGAPGLQGLVGPAGFAGLPGVEGAPGAPGATGEAGASGTQGPAGTPGSEGVSGPTGEAGPEGATGAQGEPGPEGVKGAEGAEGRTGAQGIPGSEGPRGALAYAEFYALMPGDNAATIGAGMPVQFPRDGPTSGVFSRRNADEFVLPAIGAYRVCFSVSAAEPGQLVISVDTGGGMVEVPYTVYGRATGTSLISGEAIIATTAANSAIEVRNPTGNTPALTITPTAGGTHAVVASILIEQLR